MPGNPPPVPTSSTDVLALSLINLLIDKEPKLKIDRVTGGRAVVAGHIISDNTDIFAANERGSNFLYKNNNGSFTELANKYEVQDKYENWRGTTLSDVFYRGQLDIVSSNWNGNHRIFALDGNEFRDIAQPDFNEPTRIRTVISADFENDGLDEIFMNNIGEPNKLFKILENGKFQQIQINNALEYNGLGTGAAVADIDDDGILELLISHGETGYQPLTLYKANVEKNNFLRNWCSPSACTRALNYPRSQKLHFLARKKATYWGL